MPQFKTIDLSVDQRGVAVLMLMREHKHNAMDAQMIADLTEATAFINANNGIRVVILSANGKSFCAGGDLSWMQAQASASREEKNAQSGALANMLSALDTLKVPLIGKINGNAFGGGIGLISVCDLAFARNGIRMQLTETKLGLIPATIGPFVQRAMGTNFARQVFATGVPITNDMALRSGLVAEFLAEDQLDEAIEATIKAILPGAPHAVARAKAMLAALDDTAYADQQDLTLNALSDCWEDAETQSRINAFLNKS
jgi:methylglutaconyl-CoA hydratase